MPYTRTPDPVQDSYPQSAGLLTVMSNDQIDKMEESQAEAERKQQTPKIMGLAQFLEATWEENYNHKREQNIDETLLLSLLQRNAEYDDVRAGEIEQMGGSDVYISLTGVKCRAAESLLVDVVGSAGEMPWELEPTPVPELPEELTARISKLATQKWIQASIANGGSLGPDAAGDIAAKMREVIEAELLKEAFVRAKKMQVKISDQFVEGDWEKEFDEFLTSLVTFKVGCMKGPCIRKRKKLGWETRNGKTRAKVTDEMIPTYKSVSPFDLFPSPDSTDENEGNLIERQRLRRKDLRAMIGVEGFDEDAINLVLMKYGHSGYSREIDIDWERAELEERDEDQEGSSNQTIEALEYWGSVQGLLLLRQGVLEDDKGKPIDPLEEYEMCCILAAHYVIYVGFNPEPLGRRPYSVGRYEREPGSFWGKGVPELMADIQNICNASCRSLVNNLGIASGPQVVINDINRLAVGEEIEAMTPWHIWQLQNPMNAQGPGIDFFQPNSNANELIMVYDKFSNMADEYTGIPSYVSGDISVTGAGRTSSGLEMLMSNASRGIKKVIARIGRDVIQDVVTRQFEWNMMFDPDESIKGDCKVVAVGILGLIMQEQLMSRRMQFLQMTGQNTMDQKIVGVEQRARVWRKIAKGIDMPEDSVVKTEQQLKAESDRELQAMQELKQQVPTGALSEGERVPGLPSSGGASGTRSGNASQLPKPPSVDPAVQVM